MKENTCLAVLVPLDRRTRRMAACPETRPTLRAALWSTAVGQLRELLGADCGGILPAPDPWGQPLHLPFGVVLGTEEDLFRLCLHTAWQAQQHTLAKQVLALLEQSEPICGGSVGPHENVIIARVSGRDRDASALAERMLRFAQGELSGAVCLYDLGRRSGQLSPERLGQVLSDAGSYALCVARLYPGEAVAG